jgi:hypothetical protein
MVLTNVSCGWPMVQCSPAENMKCSKLKACEIQLIESVSELQTKVAGTPSSVRTPSIWALQYSLKVLCQLLWSCTYTYTNSVLSAVDDLCQRRKLLPDAQPSQHNGGGDNI